MSTGIKIEGGSEIQVENNTISGFDTGVSVLNAEATNIKGNRLHKNIQAIKVVRSKKVKISENIIDSQIEILKEEILKLEDNQENNSIANEVFEESVEKLKNRFRDVKTDGILSWLSVKKINMVKYISDPAVQAVWLQIVQIAITILISKQS